MDSGRAISFVTLGTHDLPTLRSFYRSWGWTERDGGDEFAQFDAGGVRLALYPLGLPRLLSAMRVTPTTQRFPKEVAVGH